MLAVSAVVFFIKVRLYQLFPLFQLLHSDSVELLEISVLNLRL